MMLTRPLCVILVTALLAGWTPLRADDDAGRESPFSIGVGGRALGMGGAYVAIAGDASAPFYNPAALPLLSYQELSAMHMDLFEGTIYNYAGWVYPHPNIGGFGLSFMRIGTDNIIRRTDYVEDGEFDFAQWQMLLSYGRSLYGGFSLGANLKILHQSIDRVSDFGLGADLGMIYQPAPHLRAAVMLRDMIPPQLELTGTKETTPLAVVAGVGLDRYPVSEKTRLTLAADLLKTELRDPQVLFGAEVLLHERYALRAGYDRDNLTLGAGLDLGRVTIDYAFRTFDEIDDSHRFSVGFRFGKSIEEQRTTVVQQRLREQADLLESERRRQFTAFKTRADEFYVADRLDSALTYYQRALAFDDTNAEIIERVGRLETQLREQEPVIVTVVDTTAELNRTIETFYQQALRFYDKKLYRAATDVLDLILDIRPNSSDALTLKASIERDRDREVTAELERARQAEAENDYLRALMSYNRLLELIPDDRTFETGRARVASNLDLAQQVERGIRQYNQGRLQDARTTFRAILSIAADNQTAVEYLERIDADTERSATLEDLQKDPVAWQDYLDGLRFMRNREFDKAIESWQKVLERYPNNQNARNNIEQARLRQQSQSSGDSGQ